MNKWSIATEEQKEEIGVWGGGCGSDMPEASSSPPLRHAFPPSLGAVTVVGRKEISHPTELPGSACTRLRDQALKTPGIRLQALASLASHFLLSTVFQSGPAGFWARAGLRTVGTQNRKLELGAA